APAPSASARTESGLFGVDGRGSFIGILDNRSAQAEPFLCLKFWHDRLYALHIHTIFEYLLSCAIGDILPPLFQLRSRGGFHKESRRYVALEVNLIRLVGYGA